MGSWPSSNEAAPHPHAASQLSVSRSSVRCSSSCECRVLRGVGSAERALGQPLPPRLPQHTRCRGLASPRTQAAWGHLRSCARSIPKIQTLLLPRPWRFHHRGIIPTITALVPLITQRDLALHCQKANLQTITTRAHSNMALSKLTA